MTVDIVAFCEYSSSIVVARAGWKYDAATSIYISTTINVLTIEFERIPGASLDWINMGYFPSGKLGLGPYTAATRNNSLLFWSKLLVLATILTFIKHP